MFSAKNHNSSTKIITHNQLKEHTDSMPSGRRLGTKQVTNTHHPLGGIRLQRTDSLGTSQGAPEVTLFTHGHQRIQHLENIEDLHRMLRMVVTPSCLISVNLVCKISVVCTPIFILEETPINKFPHKNVFFSPV